MDNVRRFVRAHHPSAILIGIPATALFQAIAGSWGIWMPSAYAGGMTVMPFRHFIPIIMAAIIVGGLHSPMADMQATATSVLRRCEAAYLLCATAAALVLAGAAESFASSPASGALVVRGLLIWTGLALLSGRLFGWRMNWLLPIATVFPPVYYGLDRVGETQWWNWTGQPPDNVACWLIAAATLTIGTCAYSLTPWATSYRPKRPNSHQIGN